MAANILVVDDDELTRELLYLHLSNAGYEVHLAEDGIAAGYAVLQKPFHLLLADIEMPFMDGFDLVRAIRGEPSAASMPVIFLTSNGEHEDRAKQLGAAAFLRKPPHADQLLAAVAKHSSGTSSPLKRASADRA
jgi:DNA-binding response OmpR family regulator